MTWGSPHRPWRLWKNPQNPGAGSQPRLGTKLCGGFLQDRGCGESQSAVAKTRQAKAPGQISPTSIESKKKSYYLVLFHRKTIMMDSPWPVVVSSSIVEGFHTRARGMQPLDSPWPCLITGGYLLVQWGECRATLDTSLNRMILGSVKMCIIGAAQKRECSYSYKTPTKVLVLVAQSHPQSERKRKHISEFRQSKSQEQ